MNNQSTADENHEQHNQRPDSSELLTKIYYPDTLYPDNYTFFADRQGTSRVRSPPSMDEHPPSEPISRKQTINEIEIIEKPTKYTSSMIDRERGESETDRRRFDFKRYIPTALRPQDKNQAPVGLLDARFYTLKKTAMTVMCLLVIIMSNSVQLKQVLKQDRPHPFYGTQVTLGIISILMCSCIGVILMYVMRIDLNDQYKQYKLDYIDNCVICLLFILAIFNIFIAACS